MDSISTSGALMKTHLTNALNPKWTMCSLESSTVQLADMIHFTCIECRDTYNEAASLLRTRIKWTPRDWK